MNRIVIRLMKLICEDNFLSKENYIICQYGLQAGLEMLFCFICCLAIALKMKMPLEFILFTVIFASTRSFTGGIHMKRYWQCFIMSCGTFALLLFLTKFYIISSLKALLLILFSMCSVNYFCRKYDIISSIDEQNFYRNKLHIIFSVWLVIFIILFVSQCNRLLTISAYTFISIMFSKLVELLKSNT